MSRSARQAVIGLSAMAVVLVVIAAISSNANRSQGLRADVLSPRRAQPGEDIGITISVRDTAGVLSALEVDYGDGSPRYRRDHELACTRPFTRSDDLRHTYPAAGTYTVTAVVRTGGCGTHAEQVKAVRTIQVKALRR